jgi:hypothetical protein
MRNDVHRPAAINPADYEYVAQEYIAFDGIESVYAIAEERKRLRAHMARTGGTWSDHEHAGNCMVCGSPNAVYTVVFFHSKTNTYIRMGQDCAAKVACGDPALFHQFREACQDALRNKAGKAKAQQILIDAGLERAWELHVSELPDNPPLKILRDIIGKLIQYGSLSEAQIAFLRKLVDDVTHHDERMAARAAERAAAKDCPEGRIEIEGEVLKLATAANDFGDRYVMTVKHADGWLVWGTVPSNIAENVQRGDRVEFTATVKRSDRDSKFGFFKRPTGGRLIEKTLT